MKKHQFSCPCTSGALFLLRQLPEKLHAYVCDRCDAHLLLIDEYRQWRSHFADAPIDSHACVERERSGAEAVLSDTERVRLCPGCTRLMGRYRVGSVPDFRLDRCDTCQLVWLDKGEWGRLVSTGLSGKLIEILTDEWQRCLQVRENRTRREAQLRLRLGDGVYDELERIRIWLMQQPNRLELLGLLSRDE